MFIDQTVTMKCLQCITRHIYVHQRNAKGTAINQSKSVTLMHMSVGVLLICVTILIVLSSSRTSVRVKLGLFNAKIRNENRRYIHRLIYQLNEQDLLCHSI